MRQPEIRQGREIYLVQYGENMIAVFSQEEYANGFIKANKETGRFCEFTYGYVDCLLSVAKHGYFTINDRKERGLKPFRMEE